MTVKALKEIICLGLSLIFKQEYAFLEEYVNVPHDAKDVETLTTA